MELSEFVFRSLTQLIQGVVDAQKSAKETGAIINPRANEMTETPRLNSEGGAGNFEVGGVVEFDIALVTEDANEGEGKIAVWGIGGSFGKSSKDTVTSHIKFCVRVVLPRQTE